MLGAWVEPVMGRPLRGGEIVRDHQGIGQYVRIHIDPDLIDLFHRDSRIAPSSGSPDLATLLNRPCGADSRL
jgi:hypothetical protein